MRRENINSGFTLVEVVVSLLIFSLVMFFLLPFFVYGHRHTVNSDETTFGLQRAKDALEAFRATPYSEIDVGTNILNTALMKSTTYTTEAVITETATAELLYKFIAVTVNWQHPGQPPRSVTLRTLVSPPSE